MNNIEFKTMRLSSCDDIKMINPKQYINKAWRLVEGERKLITIDYMENDWPDGYERYRNELENIIKNNGIAIGAYEGNQLLGFVSLNRNIFGETAKYMLLDSMFVTYEARGRGLGHRLFNKCCEAAKESGADKLYICAASAEETIAFYRACGCVEAVEINEYLYQQDTRDLQLEFSLE